MSSTYLDKSKVKMGAFDVSSIVYDDNELYDGLGAVGSMLPLDACGVMQFLSPCSSFEFEEETKESQDIRKTRILSFVSEPSRLEDGASQEEYEMIDVYHNEFIQFAPARNNHEEPSHTVDGIIPSPSMEAPRSEYLQKLKAEIMAELAEDQPEEYQPKPKKVTLRHLSRSVDKMKRRITSGVSFIRSATSRYPEEEISFAPEEDSFSYEVFLKQLRSKQYRKAEKKRNRRGAFPTAVYSPSEKGNGLMYDEPSGHFFEADHPLDIGAQDKYSMEHLSKSVLKKSPSASSSPARKNFFGFTKAMRRTKNKRSGQSPISKGSHSSNETSITRKSTGSKDSKSSNEPRKVRKWNPLSKNKRKSRKSKDEPPRIAHISTAISKESSERRKKKSSSSHKPSAFQDQCIANGKEYQNLSTGGHQRAQDFGTRICI